GFSRSGYELFDLMEEIPQPILAVINGFALGGGLELALACDFRFAGEGVRLGFPEVLLGIIPGFGGTQRLVAAAGASRAKEMIFTGNKVDASTALAWGLVDRVFPEGRLWDESAAFAADLATRSQSALSQAKRVLNSTRNLPIQEGLRIENQAFSRCFEHPDSREGIRAFLEKRRPEFGKCGNERK
ncbi:MAG: enoyl-CoA hydratase-related protein, partial [Thermovirgaceae bacterium]|nr:enoyl-CoA hydratase-related protein [Thermovirgaceae bacterium]